MTSSVDDVDALRPLLSMMSGQKRTLLGMIMIYTIFGAMLVALLVALFYFSSGKRRWTPIFSFVIFDVLFGLAIAIWNVHWMASLRSGSVLALEYSSILIDECALGFTESRQSLHLHYLPYSPSHGLLDCGFSSSSACSRRLSGPIYSALPVCQHICLPGGSEDRSAGSDRDQYPILGTLSQGPCDHNTGGFGEC
jgi:hypothetical protein